MCYEVVLVFSLSDSVHRFSLSLKWARKNRFLRVQIILSLAHSQRRSLLSALQILQLYTQVGQVAMKVGNEVASYLICMHKLTVLCANASS